MTCSTTVTRFTGDRTTSSLPATTRAASSRLSSNEDMCVTCRISMARVFLRSFESISVLSNESPVDIAPNGLRSSWPSIAIHSSLRSASARCSSARSAVAREIPPARPNLNEAVNITTTHCLAHSTVSHRSSVTSRSLVQSPDPIGVLCGVRYLLRVGRHPLYPLILWYYSLFSPPRSTALGETSTGRVVSGRYGFDHPGPWHMGYGCCRICSGVLASSAVSRPPSPF